MSTEAKPFLKWAGGKGQLLSQLDEHLPSELQRQEFTYIEPFVGGGAMLFYMLRRFPNITHAVVNDINPHLVTAYRVIKEQPEELIRRLSILEQEYFSLSDEEAKKEYFLNMRTVFNEMPIDDIDRTKYLMFLNRTCFNGLYRVNAKGKFNVPFGRNPHPTICNAETILADSELLNRFDVTILNGDFERTAYEIRDGLNFFYFDPPYRPLNATSSFNSYAKEEFNDNEQIRLRDFCVRLNERPNVKWMLNNADCSAKNPNDTFF
jgi:DNA adenine methylase